MYHDNDEFNKKLREERHRALKDEKKLTRRTQSRYVLYFIVVQKKWEDNGIPQRKRRENESRKKK